jgi:hypothetical protein
MKRINLVKYGFVRWPEEDFSDDGNRFICYQAGEYENLRISKLVSDGQAYLSAQADCNLPYEIYSQLPNYQAATWQYNGACVDRLTDEDLQNFYRACCAYAQECIEAEAKIEYPTIEEITAQCEKITAKAIDQYKKASQLVVEAVLDGTITNLSDYELSTLKSDLKWLKNATTNYDPKTYPSRIYRKSSSFNFVKPDCWELNPKNFYLERIEEYMKKLKNN